MERARIGGDVFIRPFERPGVPAETELALITGAVLMIGARIGGSVFIHDDSLRNETEQLAFNRMNVSGVFRFANITCGTGKLSLANAKVAVFADEGTTWPKRGSLQLNGFEYGALGGVAPKGWRPRLDWLRRFEPSEFNPQPFNILVSVLRRAGHDRDAKRIAIARYREARKRMTWGSFRWLSNIFMEATSGHGYRPWLAAMWILLFIVIGSEVFDLDLANRTPLKEPAVTQYRNSKTVPAEYPPFQPWAYSTDVLLPIVNLQQKDYWSPNSTQLHGSWARLYLPLHVLAGWFFTTLFVVGVTGLIRRE